MKSLLIFTLSLISGPVDCIVTGYSGGSIIISSDIKWDSRFIRYFCKKESISCTDVIRTDTTKNSVQEGRFMLYENTEGFVTVLIRSLEPQDAGTYRMAIGNGQLRTISDVKLTVINDSCCPGRKTMHAFPGQNISIISNYPVVYDRDYKYIMKLDNGSVLNDILDTDTQSQNNRFSISDDRNAKVLGLSISNVTEADGGVYLCGVYNRMNSVEYFSFFTEIQLHVRAEAPIEISSESAYFSSPFIIIIIILIISVCVCVIGGFTLLMIYKLRQKQTQGSRPSSKDNEHASSVYENDLPNLPPYENLNMKMRSNHQNLDSSTNQSDSTYQTLDPLTNQSDSGYMSLTKSWTEISSDRTNFKSSSTMIIIIIIVCVCVALLLIGGFTLMAYKMRHMRTQDSAPSSKDNEQVHPGQCIYEEIDQTTHVSVTDTELYMDVTSHSPDTQISSTVPPQEQNLTYTTVSFQKNPDDAAITFRKEESTTEYATVQHTSTVE
ncbi:hypothetical protein KOW79_013403 [Hemibagrus wyckioides]|uniref:Immunoglobulin domain-containing protein n=1 Tax=Hemibagrus wyckioides TaxID=337641 RepID=A0A9D3NJC6_9TELE|nr:hypothetical protein KOW79_013403 [Hemibagrus wyckioides]